MKRFKILISAYACSPYEGSEPGMGWNFIYNLSQYNDLYVICEKDKWEAHINRKFREEPKLQKRIHFYFISKERNKFLRRIFPPSYYYFYRKWHIQTFSLAKKLHQKECFDAVHQLNMVGFREPGYLWKMNLPFVWGPIGGMENVSWKLFPFLDSYGKIFYFCRNLINNFQLNFQSRPRLAASCQNSVLISATNETKKRMKNFWGQDSILISEVGLKNNGNIDLMKNSGTIKLCWSGRLISRKALNILLRAMAQLPDNTDVILHVLGDGPLKKKWEKLAYKLGLRNKIVWHGWLEQGKAIEIMAKSDIFAITSLSDLTATVTLEALSNGMPIICLNHCGFSDVVTDQCGVKIEIDSPERIINSFAQSIHKLYLDRTRLYEMSIEARKRAQCYSWDLKSQKIQSIYSSLIDKRNEDINYS